MVRLQNHQIAARNRLHHSIGHHAHIRGDCNAAFPRKLHHIAKALAAIVGNGKRAHKKAPRFHTAFRHDPRIKLSI